MYSVCVELAAVILFPLSKVGLEINLHLDLVNLLLPCYPVKFLLCVNDKAFFLSELFHVTWMIAVNCTLTRSWCLMENQAILFTINSGNVASKI